jgi:hypothetical protein
MKSQRSSPNGCQLFCDSYCGAGIIGQGCWQAGLSVYGDWQAMGMFTEVGGSTGLSAAKAQPASSSLALAVPIADSAFWLLDFGF